MKKVIYIIIILTISTTVISCKKFLDVEPQNAVSDADPIFDLISAQTALTGTYRALGNTGYYGESWVTLGFFPSGDIKNLTTGGAANLVNVNFRSDDVNFNTTWSAIYATINRANNVIEKVPLVSSDPKLTQALKDQYVGEAKFIRALAYFDLARGWGGVQLILEPTKTLNELPKIQRSTLDQTYDQVLKDLEDAESLLPVGAAVNKIRVTQETVWALRARLHLYREQWADAQFYASKLIALTASYSLTSPYKSWFAANVVGTKESIFELEFSALNPSTIRAQMQHPSKGGTYRYAPTDAFVVLLKTANVAGGRRALIDSVSQSSITQWFGNLYYRNPATDPAYIFRIAEMYLIRAEAKAQQSDATALADLNAVRTRAGVPVSSTTDFPTLLIEIENERRLEFALEPHRWFDLARTGRAKVVLEALNAGTQVSSHEYLFPIPNLQTQLDPNLAQNPGY